MCIRDRSRGSDETDKLGARLARYHTAKKRALLNLETLKVLKPMDDFTAARYRAGAVRLADCGNYLAFRQYYTVGTVSYTHLDVYKRQEVTKDNGYGELKETGWHPHAHIMVLHTTSFDYKALQLSLIHI